jgi:predicted dehydrogenase
VYYDIRSIRNQNNPDDYYHVDLFYDSFKAILKTSHLVKAPYPKFILQGTNGSFINYGIDKQEECLKAGMNPDEKGFGHDPEALFGRLVYEDKDGSTQEKQWATPLGVMEESMTICTNLLFWGKRSLFLINSVIPINIVKIGEVLLIWQSSKKM